MNISYQIVSNRETKTFDLWADELFIGSFTNMADAIDECDRLESEDAAMREMKEP